VFIRRSSDIGALVRAARQARRLNQQGLADRLGVSRWWVNAFEQGKATTRLDLVLRALNELQITLAAYPNDQLPQDDNSSADTGTSNSSTSSDIDIDAIADTGLPSAPERRGSKKRSRP
jgi:transcriptional regulator with XRE-family HTH domain